MSSETRVQADAKEKSPLRRFRNAVAQVLAAATGLEPEKVEGLLDTPPQPDLGDFAFPCFSLAKQLRQAPPRIAEDLVEKISPTLEDNPLVDKVIATGPYINATIARGVFAREVLDEVQDRGEAYGDQEVGTGKSIVIDYSSPNIAKPFGIGHLRSTVIGAALARIHRSLGFDVHGINHLGDWGTQFGKMMVACRTWGYPGPDDPDPVKSMFELYVRFHKEAESDPSLEDQSRLWFKKLEQGDPDAQKDWDLLTEIGRKEFARIYDRLGVSFEHFTGESYYNDKLDSVVDLIREKGLLETSQEAQIVDLSAYDMPPALVKKADDSSLYLTRDLAALLYRFETFNFAKALYVVGMEQTLHFKQLFQVAELLELPFANRCQHIPFGLIRFKEGRMSTRHGKVIFLEEVLDRSVELVRNIIAEKNPDLADAEGVAKAIGIGAIVFNDLKHRRVKEVHFAWDEILNFDGKTGPYLQYTHARISSILRKAEESAPYSIGDQALLSLPEEIDLIRRLASLPRTIRNAGEECEPSLISTFLLDLAEVFNRYYNLGGKDPELRVLCENPELRTARLHLVAGVKTVLKKGLALLGVASPEKM